MDSDLINVRVNGEARQAPSGQSVAALLAWLEIPSERVAVELNRAIVRKRDWTTTQVESEASIEIVEFVGGG
jgi:thiamine biosynthesis protein ThiS